MRYQLETVTYTTGDEYMIKDTLFDQYTRNKPRGSGREEFFFLDKQTAVAELNRLNDWHNTQEAARLRALASAQAYTNLNKGLAVVYEINGRYDWSYVCGPKDSTVIFAVVDGQQVRFSNRGGGSIVVHD